MQNPLARDYARPILAENGGREVLPFTPRGENHGYDLFEYAKSQSNWHVEYLTVDDTRRDGEGENGGPVITVEAIEEHRREMLAAGIPGVDALIEQEYYLSWKAPMPGAYYADVMAAAEREGRICDFPYDPRRPVYTFWDLGLSKAHDTNSIWFVQQVGGWIHFIDYEQHSNKGMEFFAGLLNEKPYQYGGHYTREADLETADWGSGKTRFQTAKEWGVVFKPVPDIGLIDGIHAFRQIVPRARFHATNCKKGIAGLRDYRREWDEKKRVFLSTPVHNYASHPADAARYAGVHYVDQGVEVQQGGRIVRPRQRQVFDPLNWEQSQQSERLPRVGVW